MDDIKGIDYKELHESLIKLSEYCSSRITACRYPGGEEQCVLFNEQVGGCILAYYLPSDWKNALTLMERTRYGINLSEPDMCDLLKRIQSAG